MAGIFISGGENIFISGYKAINCDIALVAENANNLNIHGMQTIGCSRGALINNCWDSEFKNINIETGFSTTHYREKDLTKAVRYFMHL